MSGSKSITGIILTNTQLTNAAPAGTEVGIVQVTMSDGTKFDGTLTLGGAFATMFTINAVRDPFQISAISLSNSSVLSGQPAGTVVGTLAVAMSDGSAFSGSLRVDDLTHFSISGSNLVTGGTALTAGTSYPIQITASQSGLADFTQAFTVAVQQAQVTLPGAPTGLTAVGHTSSSITLSFGPPTTGSALDNGAYRVEYKASSSGIWLTSQTIPYCTPGSGTVTDGFGNVWSLDASTKTIIVNGLQDTASHANLLLLVGSTIWQNDLINDWWDITPTGRITSAPTNWATTGTVSPLTSVTVSSLSQGTSYDFRVWVSNTSGNSATTTVVSAVTDTPTQTSNGPAATSSFITADFTSAFNYPAGSGQQVVSQQMYGVGSSSLVNNNFGAFADANTQTNMAIINPGLYMLKNGGFGYWNSNLSVNTAVLANLVNNFYKFDPLGVAKVWLSVDRSMVPNTSPSNFATAMANLARYLIGVTMPNGKPFPLLGFSGEDEPEGRIDEATMATFYNAAIPAVKAVSSNLLFGGPQDSFLAWTEFGTRVPQLDFFVYNCFNEGSLSGGFPIAFNDVTTGVTNMLPRYASDADGAVGATGANLKAVAMAGYGMDWDAAVDAQNSHVGAIFVAAVQLTLLNHARLTQWPCLWGGWGNGTAGVITDPVNQAGAFYGVTNVMQVTPKGYFMAQGVRNVFGPRWQVPTNSPGVMTLACSPGSGRAALLLINVGRGSRSGTVALSHCPVGTNMNASGNGTANVWQMTSAQPLPGQDGTRATVPVTAGVTGSITLPDPSITIIST